VKGLVDLVGEFETRQVHFVEIAGNVTPAGFQPWARSWRTSPLLKDRNSWTKPILE